jgi:DNA polymerase-3 subunit alpha
MTALLTQDMGNQDKTIKNIAECRELGIRILPPDLNESQPHFAVVKEGIRFGLAAVKNVGMKAVESIIEERNGAGPFKDLMDFCRRVDGSKVNRRVLEGLIQCGAFDFTEISRAKLFGTVDEVARYCGAHQNPNQLNMFTSLVGHDSQTPAFLELAEVKEWDEKERLRREREALGFYITGHPLDRYRMTVERHITCSLQGLSELSDRTQVKVAGVVENLKIKRTKRGDKMATLTLEDPTGSVPAVLFPEVFNNHLRLLKAEEPLLFTGTAEIDDNSTKIIAQEIVSLEQVRQQSIRAIELTFRQEGVSRESLEEIKGIVFRYPGECSILFRVRTEPGREVLIAAHDHYRVLPCEQMINEIESLTGQKVVYRYADTNPSYARSAQEGPRSKPSGNNRH